MEILSNNLKYIYTDLHLQMIKMFKKIFDNEFHNFLLRCLSSDFKNLNE